MERRLRAAKPLLRETGVVIVAIGDDEHHRLRMLMDQVFGADNFVSDNVWIGSVKNDARFSGGGLDYMLIYAKDLTAMTDAGLTWREPKEGLEDVLDAGAKAWQQSGHDSEVASRLLSNWWGKNKHLYDPGLGDNVKVDEHGTVIKVSDLRSPNPRPTLQYDLLHPVTRQPVRRHPNGWVYTEAVMEQLVADGRILFGKDHTSGARKKTPLRQMSTQSVRPQFYRDRRAATRHLTGVLGDRRFPFPKDHQVLARWIGITAPADAVVLDFFGGSGSTMEAVLRLNAEDGGNRQCLLVTNNELAHKDATALREAGYHPGDEQFEAKGVFRHVAHPRIKTVVTGVREDGSVYDKTGLAANVAFYSLTQLDPGRVRRGREFTAIAPILWMQAGGVGPVIDREADDFTLTDTYGVLFDTGHRRAFTQAANEHQTRTAFIVTDSSATFRDVAAGLPASVRPVQLYESYLSNFEVNTTRLEA